MDFGTLLHVAQKKAETNKNDVKYYSTKFEPPKKEERHKKQLSANIQKFLARKEAEEKQKAEEARIKKLELLALRSQDSKAKKRIQCMLQRTKSANKSVIDDAVDNKDTALTLAGPSQPDEDDYGYESQESAAIYAKMMERYSQMPEEVKFGASKKKVVSTNLASTKERVKAALLREEEEANMPHKRKRKSKSSTDDTSKPESDNSTSTSVNNNSVQEVERNEVVEKPRPKRPPPPIMNFSDLLKIAEKKQFEPIVIEPKKVDSDEILLTKKQKKEMEKEKAWRDSREARLRAALTAPRPQKPSSQEKLVTSSTPFPNKIPKLNSSDTRPPKVNSEKRPHDSSASSSNLSKIRKVGSDFRPERRNDDTKNTNVRKPDTSRSDSNRIPLLPNKSQPSNSGSKDVFKKPAAPPNLKPSDGKVRQYLPGDLRAKQQEPSNSKPRQYLPGDLRAKQQETETKPRQYLPGDLRAKQQENESKSSDLRKKQQESESKPRQYLPGDIRAKQEPNAKSRQYLPGDLRAKQNPQTKQSVPAAGTSSKSKPFPPTDLKPKQFPPADLKPKQFPPADLKPKQFPPADLRPKQFPPADLRPKQFPPADVRGKQFPPRDVKRKQPRRPIIQDDDSEYDSEMDDFIDDGPLGGEEDYSKHIKEIFGYDKSRYRDADDDDDAAMESKFSTILKEEYISTKIGIMEDLEDIRKEAEEKKRKALLMKKKMKR